MRRAAPLLIVGLLLAVLIVSEALRPRPYDERLRMEREGTEPFDAEILFRLLPAWLGAPVEPVDGPPFEHLADTALVGTAYLFATGTFDPDPAETERLLAYAARGNTVVVAAEELGAPFGDALVPPDTVRGTDGLRIEWRPSGLGLAPTGLDGTDTLRLVPPAPARPGGYRVPVDLGETVLQGAARAEALDVLGVDARGDTTLVRLAVGRGAVVVSSTPLVLSNAALAGEGDAAAYVAGVLGAVPPVRRVFWDGYHKPLRAQIGTRVTVALRTPALRWALWLIALGAVALVLFRGRRWQRPIPVVAPPPNAQREFARVLGRLHFTQGDAGWLARQKARTFESALRTRLGLVDLDPAEPLSDATATRAARRAGVPEADARALFARLRRLRDDPAPADAALLALSRDLDAFLARADAPARPRDLAPAPPPAP